MESQRVSQLSKHTHTHFIQLFSPGNTALLISNMLYTFCNLRGFSCKNHRNLWHFEWNEPCREGRVCLDYEPTFQIFHSWPSGSYYWFNCADLSQAGLKPGKRRAPQSTPPSSLIRSHSDTPPPAPGTRWTRPLPHVPPRLWEVCAAQAQSGGHSQKPPGPTQRLLCFRSFKTWSLSSHRRPGGFGLWFFFRISCCKLRVSGTVWGGIQLGSPRRRLCRLSQSPRGTVSGGGSGVARGAESVDRPNAAGRVRASPRGCGRLSSGVAGRWFYLSFRVSAIVRLREVCVRFVWRRHRVSVLSVNVDYPELFVPAAASRLLSNMYVSQRMWTLLGNLFLSPARHLPARKYLPAAEIGILKSRIVPEARVLREATL